MLSVVTKIEGVVVNVTAARNVRWRPELSMEREAEHCAVELSRRGWLAREDHCVVEAANTCRISRLPATT
jgi:hypothetical protein